MSQIRFSLDEVQQGLRNLGIDPECVSCSTSFFTGHRMGSCACVKSLLLRLYDNDSEAWHCEYVLQWLDRRMLDGQWSLVQKFLNEVHTGSLHDSVVVAIVTATYHGKQHLVRDSFLLRAEETLTKRLGAERAAALLDTRR